MLGRCLSQSRLKHVIFIYNIFHITAGGAVLEDGDGIDLVQCYNPRTNQWVELSKMLIARSGSAACVLNGHIYVIGNNALSTCKY